MTTNTRIENILNSVSTIDAFIIKFDDGETAYVKAKSYITNFAMAIDYINKTDEEIRDYIISEVSRAVALNVHIHG